MTGRRIAVLFVVAAVVWALVVAGIGDLAGVR